MRAMLNARAAGTWRFDNVRGEWNLVTMAWNMKRMFVLAGAN
jgi:hypothetical protein